MTDPALVMPSPSFIEVHGLRIRISQSSPRAACRSGLPRLGPKSTYAINFARNSLQ